MENEINFELVLGSLQLSQSAFQHLRIGSEIEFKLPNIFKGYLKFVDCLWAEVQVEIASNSGNLRILSFKALPSKEIPNLQETLPELLR